jgi:ABC-type ATPase with predicted acetyltransferase domain
MHYIGETQGNLDRVSVDMKYILKNYERVKNREILKEETAGIVDLQVHYATQLKHIEEERGVPLRELLKMLVESPENLSDESWTLLHRILRLPKPTFMKGLTPAAEQFVKRRIKALSLPAKYVSHGLATTNTTLAEPIRVENCSFTISSFPAKTRSTRKIQQAFGVNRDTLDTTMFTDLSFEIYPGDVVLICGPSGAGKTTLLSLLEKSLKHPRKHHAGLEGSINVPASVSVASLGRLHGSRPLINSLGRASFEEALYALNASGLAEAHLYVKRPSELSNGQRYRAMVAKLIASRSAVWVADEFCATLDPVTANIVSRNLRRSAKDLGVTVITAAASWGDFIHELRPDTVVHLRAPWDVAVFSWDELTHALASSPTLGPNVTLGSS